MTCPNLYRERIFPKECILLKDDEILFYDGKILITKWQALKPKQDLQGGYSCYFLDEGYKISKFYQHDNTLLYWYCDIIDTTFIAAENKLVVTDLLADVIVYPNGFVKVVDLEEIPLALDNGCLSYERVRKCMASLGALLGIIYGGGFEQLQKYIEDYENAAEC